MRRANRERIYQAKLAGLRNRVRDEWRQTEAAADALLLEWETEAATRGLERTEPAYWSEGATWIEEHLAR